MNTSINVKNYVIATGGSVIYGSKKTMEHTKESGVIVYLKLSYNTIKRRLRNLKQRGGCIKAGTDTA